MPPVELRGSRLFYMPLPASMDRMQSLVDNYLNTYSDPFERIPSGLNWFGVSAPLVYLTLADYGSLSTDAVNQGWVAYDEILFAIPINWYQRSTTAEPFSFKAWATFAPIIFVSNQAAQWIGREILGWVKTLAQIRTPESAWAYTGAGTSPVLSVATKGFEEPFTGQTQGTQRVLTITHDGEELIGRIPPSYSQLANPLTIGFEAASAGWRLMNDVFEGMFGRPIAGLPPGLPNPFDAFSYARLLDPLTWPQTFDPLRVGNTATMASQVLSSLPFQAIVNTVNRKQFPDAQQPMRACYSAITNSPLEFTEILAMGMLGAREILQGQSSGGYQIHIPFSNSLPIVDLLGLQTSSTLRDIEGQRIDIVEPVFPTWIWGDLSIRYAENYDVGFEVPFRNSLPQSRPAGTPPFAAPASTVRVLPLRADPDTVNKFLANYFCASCMFPPEHCGGQQQQCKGAGSTLERILELVLEGSQSLEPCGHEIDELRNQPERLDDPDGSGYRMCGTHVYLVISEYPRLSSITRPAGVSRVREVTFMFPARLDEQSFWVAPYGFTDNDAWGISMRETNGMNTLISVIESPPNDWLEVGGRRSGEPEEVLDLLTELVPAFGVGQPAELRSITQVFEGRLKPPAHSHGSEVYLPKLPAETMAAEGSIQAQAFFNLFEPNLEVSDSESSSVDHDTQLARSVAQGKPVTLPILTLKQFRDAENPNEACYQEAVVSPITYFNRKRHKSFRGDTYVKMPLYTTLPIATMLGLQPDWIEDDGGRLVYVFESNNGVSFDADVRFDLGRVVDEPYTPVGT